MGVSIEQVVAEVKEREAGEKARLDADIEAINAPHRAVKAKEDAERKQTREAEQRAREEQAERELEAEAREKFFWGSPGASEKLYLTVREDIRKEVLFSRTREAERRFQNARNHSIYKN